MAGPKNATTDEVSGLRWYTWLGERYLSVTSLRRILGMPFNLAMWQVGQVVDAAYEHAESISMQKATATNDKQRAAVKTFIRKHAMANRDKAGSLGTAVHEATDMGLAPTDGSLTDEMRPFIAHYHHAVKTLGLTTLLSERQVWSKRLRYAGSLDRVWQRGTNVVLGDLKTGKGLYVEHLLQLMAYSLADFVGEDDIEDAAATKLLWQVNRLAVLHLQPDGWEYLEIEPTKEAYRAFEAMVTLANFMRANDSLDPFITTRITGAAPEEDWKQ